MNQWLYHDIKRAEHILKHGFDRKDIAVDMKILCMYYRDVLGYKPKERRNALENFCKKHIKGYNEVLYYRVIDNALNFAKRKNSRLVEIEKIDIYKSEVDYINNLPVEPNFKRILFTLLVFIKLHKTMLATIYTTYKHNYMTGRKTKDSDIFQAAHITSKITKKYYFYMLELIGYIVTYRSGVMNVKIFDKMPIDTSNVAIEVKNFDYTGFYLDDYNHDPKIIHCCICGVPVRSNTSHRDYCNEHSYRMPAEVRKYVCIDCGDVYYKLGTASLRCDACAEKYRKEVDRQLSKERMRRYRERQRLKNQ